MCAEYKLDGVLSTLRRTLISHGWVDTSQSAAAILRKNASLSEFRPPSHDEEGDSDKDSNSDYTSQRRPTQDPALTQPRLRIQEPDAGPSTNKEVPGTETPSNRFERSSPCYTDASGSFLPQRSVEDSFFH